LSLVKTSIESSIDVQDALFAKVLLLEKLGPMLGRPHVDTLNLGMPT